MRDTVTSLELRLREALAQTHDRDPRPVARLELPLAADRWFSANIVNQLRPAAVLAPILRREDGLSMMLTRRADHLSSHQGQISFPGGRRDPGDGSAMANALREAQEEVGLDPASVEVLGYLDDYPTISRYLVTPVVGLVQAPVAPMADPGEVAEVFEVPMSVLLDPRAYRKKTLSRDGFVVPYYEVTWSGYRIWGATAGMLWDLCSKVHARG